MEALRLQSFLGWLKNFLPYTVYGLVALLIMYPLLTPGYILTLDMVFTPKLPIPQQVGSSYLLQIVLYIINFVLPGDVIEKLLLVVILLLAGIGMHRLMAYLDSKTAPASRLFGCFCAGLLYMVNPFVYDRSMAGQYSVLFGYALLPWFLESLLMWMKQPNWRRTVALSAWTVLIGIVSIHTLGFLTVLSGLALAGKMWQRRKDHIHLLSSAKWLGMWLTISFLASNYWLVPALSGHGMIAQEVNSFGTAQRQAYSTVDTNGDGVLLAVLGLQGFWADVRQLYILPNDAIEYWPQWQLLFWVVILIGLVTTWRRDRWQAAYFTGIAVISAVLAIGVCNDWLAAHIPFFAGYREPQKFVALLTLAYCYFMYRAAILFTGWLKRVGWLQFLPAAAVCVLIALYVWPIWWGFDTQLHPVQYPADWYAINTQLNHDPARGSVLFLPWHLYMSFNFSDRIIANPAPKFFDRPVIVSDDPEFNNAGPSFYDPLKYQVSHIILPAAAAGQPVAAQLKQLGIHYVLLAKELDWQRYDYWSAQPKLKLLAQTRTLLLYKIE